MPKPLTSPDRLFERTWRPGHPFGPRLSGRRRWSMTVAFVVLCVVIGGYLFLTDSRRVRRMAEDYLSRLLGGPVHVGGATLSIFEGLRLDGVRLYAAGTRQEDSELFAAESFIVSYNPRALLRGQIEATRIIAVDPKLSLTENLDTGVWSHERLGPRSVGTGGGGGMAIARLPEILLRNATVEYRQMEKGQVHPRGWLKIEGQLTPVGDGKSYSFQFQSRGRRQSMGPVVAGYLDMTTRQVTASLRNFEFGDDIKTMLPSPVRKWWEQHQLAGSLDVNELTFIPPTKAGDDPGFKAEIALHGVTLTVEPQEWMSADEHRRLRILHHALNVMRVSGLNGGGMVDRIDTLVQPAELKLHDVHATFVFTESGIDIRNFTGKLEDISFKINGTIAGYSPAAAWDLDIASLETRNVEIPASPRYVTSMPHAVREVYDRFRPRGECSFWVRLYRPEPGTRLRVTGEINVIDGNFVFDRFPYPLRKATGRIVLSHDEKTGHEGLRIDRIRGRGLEDGPNRDAYVEINGSMGPFRSDMGVDVVVSGEGITSEPALIAAFPQQTRTALKFFDAPGKGELPQFRGDFACRIIRLQQRVSKWIIQTDIELEDGAGMLVTFPYPVSGVRGRLKVMDDHVEIIDAQMSRGAASVLLNGKVSWRDEPGRPRPAGAATQPTLRPDLRLVAKNVPIDEDLLGALPPERRAWLEKLGLGGTLDAEGTIRAAAPVQGQSAAQNMELDLRLNLHDGAMWRDDTGAPAITGMSGEMRLTAQRLVINGITGARGDARIDANGMVNFTGPGARMMIQAQARDLLLDESLYKMLPSAAKRGWEQVRPQGTVDATLTYSGAAASTQPAPTTQPGSDAVAAAPDRGGFELTLTPKKLSATPAALPYRLDQLAGTLSVIPDRVTLRDITAEHGEARVSISGTGSPAPDGPWDFIIRATSVPVDDDLRQAVPRALAELMTSIKLNGAVNFEFTKLHVAGHPAPVASTAPASGESPRAPDIDFAVAIDTLGGSMDVGVPLDDVRGRAELTGSTRDGKLYDLDGTLSAPTLTMARRPVTDFRATIYKPRGQDALQIGKLESRIADGTMAGEVNLAFPDTGASRYAVALVLRDADVPKLTGDAQKDVRGQLSASLAIEGTYNDPASRRGRGDVSVTGEEMYRIPLVLGLLQITNLALPITSPFREASVRYSIQGGRVTFEQIELRAKEMMMQGTGHLDFGTRQVRMTFTTDSVNWPKVPFIGDLLQTARRELLQVHVRGTLEEPKVSASSMNTFTTTVDEVLRGNPKTAEVEKKN